MTRLRKNVEKNKRNRKGGYNQPSKTPQKATRTKKRDKKREFDGREADTPTKRLGTNWEYITSNFKNLIYLIGVGFGAYFIYKGVRDEHMNIKIGDVEFNTSMVGAIIILLFAIALWRNKAKVKV